MKKRLADYLVGRLFELTGSRHCFLLAGGGMMHLLDALDRSKQITAIPMHHEQAAAIAADGYGRVNNTVGIVFVTSGPGCTNAITAVAGAWLESTPLLVISGQVSRSNWKWNSRIRQMGFQEIDIIPIVKSITKYSIMVMEPGKIRYHLEKAIFLARSGRPGPVWLDIPLDVQAASVDVTNLKSFDKSEIAFFVESKERIDRKIALLLKWISKSKRPLLLAGHGIWLANGKDLFKRLVNKLQIPVQTSWNGIDLIEESNPLFFGRPNSYGPRFANFIVQNCDLFISIGSRLGLQQIGFNYNTFLRQAKKVIIDVDQNELRKHTVHADLPINSDAKYFLERLLHAMKATNFKARDISEWVNWCNERKKRYPACSEDLYCDDKYVDAYVFAKELSEVLPKNSLIIPGSSGTCFTVTNQVFKIKSGQRLFTHKGLAAMGYGLPSSIGGCFANMKREVVTIIGDGGFQLNIQELQTIAYHKLPIKIFVLNNQGYLSIRTTQLSYFKGRFIGSDEKSGVSLPDLKRIANAYRINYVKVVRPTSLKKQIEKALKVKGAVICEVILNPKKILLPKLASYKRKDGSMVSRPIEDLAPLLSRKELQENMIIPVWKEKVK